MIKYPSRDVYFRLKMAPHQNTRPTSAFYEYFRGPDLRASEGLWKAYQKWRIKNQNNDFARFREDYMANRELAREKMQSWPSPFANAKKGEEYAISFRLPDWVMKYKFCGLEKAGLVCTPQESDPRNCVIKGIPPAHGQYKITLFYVWPGWERGLPVMAREFDLLVNPDPRELWEDKPSDQTAEYARPDLDFAELKCPPALMWGASRRGRSHAHTGLPRDDAFSLACASGWHILTVADGAGSAEFSRRGAELACQTAIASARDQLAVATELDAIFDSLPVSADPATWQAQAKKLAYAILPNAAFMAHKSIRQEAENRGRESRLYATTLLLAMAKKYANGWAVMSFQIGDGAMALFADGKAELLAEPDEGEYGGQTRFVTMTEVFEPRELMGRLRLDFVKSLTGLLLMTDGISDARFVTLEGLRNKSLWQELWQELLPLARSADPEKELLEWLNFWSKGNHDDRTLAMLALEQ